MQYQAVFVMVNRLVASTLVIACLVTHRPLWMIFVSYLAADLIDAIGAAWLARSRIQQPARITETASMLRLTRASVPFALQLLAGQIYFYVDTVLLHYLYRGTPEQVKTEIGYYTNASQVVLTLVFIPLSVCN